MTTVSSVSAPYLPSVVLIDRELCVFERFATPAVGRAARAAARIYGRSAAPFDRAGLILTPCPGGYGLWWWDADQVDALLADRFPRGVAAMAPETLAQPVGTGWRQVRLANGYEAQRWEAGKLVASSWRPETFTPSAWTNFSRTAVETSEETLDRPPTAQSLPIISTPLLLLLGARKARAGSYGQLAVAGSLALALGLGAFFGGQAWRLDALADAAEAEAAALATARPNQSLASLRTQLAQLDSFSALLDRPDPSASLAVAVGVLQLYGAPPQDFSATADGVRLTLPYSALDLAPEIAAQFAAAGGFSDVRISTGASQSSIIFEMTPPPAGAVPALPAPNSEWLNAPEAPMNGPSPPNTTPPNTTQWSDRPI